MIIESDKNHLIELRELWSLSLASLRLLFLSICWYLPVVCVIIRVVVVVIVITVFLLIRIRMMTNLNTSLFSFSVAFFLSSVLRRSLNRDLRFSVSSILELRSLSSLIVVPPVKHKVHLLPETLAEVVEFFSLDPAIVVVAFAEAEVDLGKIDITDVAIVITVDIIVDFGVIIVFES